MQRDVIVVAHTHWDREWYEPFQTFRLALVDMVDELLDILETDPDFEHFMLDGQMAVVDDYLEIRPQNEDRIRALVGAGRLTIGPWYTLPDEFMVSGETLIRNLSLGLERAQRFGVAMQIGYLPDMFGHIAQMPQLLRQFGFTDAVVWRGVPSAVDHDTFDWVSPDGSRVTALYLVDGYANGADLADDSGGLVDAIEGFVKRNREMLGGPVTWMVGSDHRKTRPSLPRLIEEANVDQDRYRLRLGTLEDVIASTTVNRNAAGAVTTWTGELRSSARANLLMGVTSNRVDIHRLCAAAERQLEKWAEPLYALFLPPGRWPKSELDLAWLEMIRNAAHDSSCACSVDEVCDAVANRYREAFRIAEGLTARALDHIAGSSPGSDPLIVNPTPRARSGVIELTIPDTASHPGTQIISVNDGVATADGLDRTRCATTAIMALDNLPGVHGLELSVDDSTMVVDLHVDPDRPRMTGVDTIRQGVSDLAELDPHGPARLTIHLPPSTTLLTMATDIPGFGWRPWIPTTQIPHPVTVTGEDPTPTITNGLVTVRVDPDDGTFTLETTDRSISGLGKIVDDGDGGDTYNWSPPLVDRVIDTPSDVRFAVLERGPLRARIEIVRTYHWPERSLFGERAGEAVTHVTTTITLEASNPAVGVTVTLDNRCRDHRLRIHFPLPDPTDHSVAECAFGTVRRGLDAQGGPSETGLATFPARRFVCAGGLTVTHDSLAEYELVDREPDGGAHTIALTVLRSTALLSNGPMAMRTIPAGPIIPVEGAQVQGTHTARYALALGDDIDAAYRLADEAWVPMAVVSTSREDTNDGDTNDGDTNDGDTNDDGHAALQIEGAQVSSVVADDDALVVRVFNPMPNGVTVRIPGRSGHLVNLLGAETATFDGSFPLGPHAIATLRINQPE